MALLVLLQGFNPLPNYVVANYLLMSDQRLFNEPVDEILVFYSEKNLENVRSTKDFADHVRTEIEQLKPGQVKISLRSLANINDGPTIRHDIKEGVGAALGSHGHIHLSYSGGTKSASVHSYKAIETLCNESNVRFTTSYLDDRRHLLYWDEIKAGVSAERPVSLYDKVQMTMDRFLALHGYENCSKNNDPSPEGSESENSLRDRMLELWKEHPEQYRTIQRVIKKLFYLTREYPTGVKKFQEHADRVKSDIDWNALEPVVGYLPTLQSIRDGTHRATLTRKVLKADRPNVRCICGIWFEDYVRRQMYRDAEKPDQTDGPSWVLNMPDTFGQSLVAKRTGQKEFELDVYLIVGYQLIGVSVTTEDDRSLCKNKGFEVIHRTRQIGGEGRMAFLVTMLCDANRDSLQQELRSDSDISERFQVFGESDLDTIGAKIVQAVKTYGG